MNQFWGFIVLLFAAKTYALGILPGSKQIVPNVNAVISWQEVPGYRDSDVDPLKVARVPLACGDKNLYPTHPQQSTKHYHVFLSARYDHMKLKGDDEACAMASPHTGSDGRVRCLRPDYLEYAVISDIYRDSCGHLYRGYFDVAFLKAHDNMGVLFAKGRTLYPRSDSPYANDMYVGDTYPVENDEFLFLGPVLDGDLEKTAELQAKALQTSHELRGLLWISSPVKP